MLVLLTVILTTWRSRRAITSWEQPVLVVLHPFAVDSDPETAAYVAGLDARRFEPAARFLREQAARYGIERDPLVQIELGPAHQEAPPLPASEPSLLDAVLFSLRLRWWSHRFESDAELPPANVRLYVLYHRPEPGAVLEHSIGLEQGHVGIVHAFAGEPLEPHNDVVIVHELLHTAGATDKSRSENLRTARRFLFRSFCSFAIQSGRCCIVLDRVFCEWKRIEPLLPKRGPRPRGGRPRVADRVVMAGIVYRLRTGCQWKALPREFSSGSTCHSRFAAWCAAGIFTAIFAELLRYYDRRRGIQWKWTSLDSAIVKAPDGYADPQRTPARPQAQAEIMAGMIPIDDDEMVLARDLGECVVGAKTAEEIGWR